MAASLRTRNPTGDRGALIGAWGFNVAASLRTRNLGGTVAAEDYLTPTLQCGRVAEDAESSVTACTTSPLNMLQCGRVAEDAESALYADGTGPDTPLQCGRVAEDAESQTAIRSHQSALHASMWPRR